MTSLTLNRHKKRYKNQSHKQKNIKKIIFLSRNKMRNNKKNLLLTSGYTCNDILNTHIRNHRQQYLKKEK